MAPTLRAPDNPGDTLPLKHQAKNLSARFTSFSCVTPFTFHRTFVVQVVTGNTNLVGDFLVPFFDFPFLGLVTVKTLVIGV
jgi:hypothetical protein